MKRRTLLKAGIAGSVLLAASRLAAPVGAAPTPAFRFLAPAEARVLERIIPVMLAGALPDGGGGRAALAEVLRGVDASIGFQSPTVREEIRELFGLLTNPVTRALVAGVWSPWEAATDASVGVFLAGWRSSRFLLLRSAYVGLNNLIVGSWYASPSSWPRIGYPGPPAIPRAAA